MAVQYDWSKIHRAAKGRVGRIITIFSMLAFKRKPLSNKDPKSLYYGKDFKGNSFMLNPVGLFEFRSSYTDAEICQYIALASLRNYSQYILTGDKTLSLLTSPLSTEKLKANRLLEVKDGRIYFLYEEVYKER